MKRACYSSALVFVVFVILAAVVLYGAHRRHYGNIKFSGTVWRSLAGKGRMDNPRQRMVKDLRARYLKPGMTRQQVRQLLGKPDYGSHEREVDSYFLGVWGFMSVDATVLEVRYDKAGRVVSTDVAEH